MVGRLLWALATGIVPCGLGLPGTNLDVEAAGLLQGLHRRPLEPAHVAEEDGCPHRHHRQQDQRGVLHGDDPTGWRSAVRGTVLAMGLLLWLIAAVLVIVGIVQLLQGQIILGVVLIIVGCLVGPGGYSIFNRR